jgi:nitrogen PTS system EIIA component
MQFDVRDAAAVFNVRESTVYRWIHERDMPATGFAGQYRFGRAELLEWATSHNVKVSPDAFAKAMIGKERFLLSDALEAGGVFHDVPSGDKPSVLRSVVERLPLPDGCDREMILQLFLARELTGSTTVCRGVAVPHPRHPVVLGVTRPMLSLCFLATPVDFGAADGAPVHTLFVLLSPTVQAHLQVLAGVACLLRDEPFQRMLAEHATSKQALAEVHRVELTFEHPIPVAVPGQYSR